MHRAKPVAEIVRRPIIVRPREMTRLLLVALFLGHSGALQLPAAASRRTLLGRREAIFVAPAALGSALVAGPAWASGGATAGKTTSIPRAKTRYYGRVSAVVASRFGAVAPT